MSEVSKADLDYLESQARRFILLMKQGNFPDARIVAAGLESSTYVLDPVWVKGYEARQSQAGTTA
jgi:hypothetical protein